MGSNLALPCLLSTHCRHQRIRESFAFTYFARPLRLATSIERFPRKGAAVPVLLHPLPLSPLRSTPKLLARCEADQEDQQPKNHDEADADDGVSGHHSPSNAARVNLQPSSPEMPLSLQPS